MIAVEGAETGEECTYFANLESLGIVDRTRVKILPLPVDPASHKSAPKYVLERMDEHCARFRMRETFDHHWLVLDVDSWLPDALSEVTQEARQKSYGVAVSNPCFELWLVLHATEDLGFLNAVGPRGRSNAAKKRIKELRNDGKAELTAKSMREAEDRARRLDIDASARWPQQPGSHVYKLVEALAAAGVLNPDV